MTTTTKQASAGNRSRVAAIPVYERIAQDIRARIESGFWEAGAYIPSRRSLASEYSVHLRTLQHAISLLIEDGTLDADSSRGTRVPSRKVDSKAQYTASPQVNLATGDAKVGIIAPLDDSKATVSEAFDFGSPALVQALERAVAETGGSTLFENAWRHRSKISYVAAGIDDLLAAGADAIVLVNLSDAEDIRNQAIAASLTTPRPLIYVSSHPLDRPISQVTCDIRGSGYQMAEHLLARGHRRILFIASYGAPWVDQRVDAARAAVQHAAGPRAEIRLYPSQLEYPARNDGELREAHTRRTQQAGHDAALAAFDDNLIGYADGQYSAIIAANDYTAYGVIAAADERGFRPGKDFAIGGFDDAIDSRMLGLTSVRRPIGAMGREAARLAIQALGGNVTNANVRLNCHLVIRQTTSARFDAGSGIGVHVARL
ncbi:MAG: GntR family transcriptional regulator [Capsulimonadaceae bacterium]|nr:GntR family transcriptional regulator [Capsulimonadaceae bacterium]